MLDLLEFRRISIGQRGLLEGIGYQEEKIRRKSYRIGINSREIMLPLQGNRRI
jgi:hypothetical protein